ncbi:hypothetical protein KY289_034411 [Solanum tuberosum]|nr:hypothetical protein KY289_034411 [Solanum tuberosum]
MSCCLNHLPAITLKNGSVNRISKRVSCSMLNTRAMAKELYFNHDGSTTKKLLAGVDLVAELVGVTLGPKGRNVVLGNKYGPPKIVNDGETVLKEIQLDDPLEYVGVKLVREAGAKTNNLAGDGCTTSIVLARGLIAEGVKVTAMGANVVQVSRGIEKTAKALISELKLMSREVEDHELEDVAAVSAGNDYAIGSMISEALRQVGREGVVTIEKGNSTKTNLEVVEGMQFDRGYLSPYFVTDRRKRIVELHDCKLLLVDKKISNPKELVKILDSAVKEKYPVLIIAEGIEQDALAPVIRNKLRGVLKVAAIKAPSFGERKSHCLDDIAILTGGTVIRDDMGLTLENAHKDLLGSASKVVITKDSTLIVTDGNTRTAVSKRVSQIQNLVENTEEKFQKKILNERIARLSGGIAIIQVGAQTQVELKDKQLRIEDALNAARAATEEGVVVGGGCCLLRLSSKVDAIKEMLDNEDQKIGADIFKRALSYPAKQIAKNAGVNGSIVVEKILSVDDMKYGYNAARDRYEDLMAAKILDPTKVVRCCLEHAAAVAKTFLISDAVVIDIPEPVSRQIRPPPPPMPTSGKSSEELTYSLEFFRDIVTGPFEKFMRVTLLLPLTGKQFSEKVAGNCVAIMKSIGTYSDAERLAIVKFLNVFKSETFSPGAFHPFYSISGWIIDVQISFSDDDSVPGSGNAVVENKPLSEAVLESMIGKNGVSPAAKRSLAKRVSEMLEKSNAEESTKDSI